jgi:hypothetical protein
MDVCLSAYCIATAVLVRFQVSVQQRVYKLQYVQFQSLQLLQKVFEYRRLLQFCIYEYNNVSLTYSYWIIPRSERIICIYLFLMKS